MTSYRPCAGCDSIGDSCRAIGCPAVTTHNSPAVPDPTVEALSEAQMTALAIALHQGLHGVNVPAGMTSLNPCIDTTDPTEHAAQIEFVTLALRWALHPHGGNAAGILTARAAAPDGLRAQVLEWIDWQRQILPEHRTPVAHGKAELLAELRALLEDGAQ